jgi:predicted O-linked N-acetylglucosamine transferase (SPINDLY family)
VKLAGDPALMRAVRDKLAHNRSRTPLFDTDRFRRHIEMAYTTMLEISRSGENPRSFAVAAEPENSGA